MLTRIKIQCGCGQRYAFDIEPIGHSLPGPVSCPACGADGTAAGNSILAQRASAPAEIAVAAPALVAAGGGGGVAQMQVAAVAQPVRSAPAAAPTERRRLPGQLEPERARNEARSKILWGDDPADVAKFLQAQGFNFQEAQETIGPLVAERALAVRNAGKAKIITGIGMMCVPVIAFVVFIAIGFFPVKIFGATVAIGFWGLWRAISGTIMFVSPKSEKGDIGDM